MGTRNKWDKNCVEKFSDYHNKQMESWLQYITIRCLRTRQQKYLEKNSQSMHYFCWLTLSTPSQWNEFVWTGWVSPNFTISTIIRIIETWKLTTHNLFTLFSSRVFAENLFNWTYIATSEDGTKYYADKNSIRKNKSEIILFGC